MNVPLCCMLALASVSLAFSPALAANSGLLAASYCGADSSLTCVAGDQPAQSPLLSVTDAQGPEAEQMAPALAGDAKPAQPSAFSPEETAALNDASLTAAETEEYAGAGVVVVGLGGILLVGLIVVLILLLVHNPHADHSGMQPRSADV